MSGAPKIVLALGNATEINALLPYAKALAGYATIDVLFDHSVDSRMHGGRVAGLPGLAVLEPGAAIESLPVRALSALRLASPPRGRAFLDRSLRLWRHRYGLFELERMQAWSARYLDAEKPAAILTGSDRELTRRLALIQAGHARKIPVFVLPAAFPAFAASLIEFRRRDGRYEIAPSSELPRRHPRQIIETPDGKRMSYFPPALYTPHLDRLGLLRGDPWLLGGMWADKVLAPDRHVAREYAQAGFPPEKVAIVGSLELDALAIPPAERQERQNNLLARYGLPAPDGGKPVIGWSVHQYAEHQMCSPERSLAMMRDVAQALLATGGTVLASLHPKMDPARYRWLDELDPRLKVVREPLAPWLGLCDLFCACAYSSTIAWAAALGIPTAVYDFLGIRDPMFDHLAAMRVAYDEKAFAALMEQATSPDAWRQWQEQAAADREESLLPGGAPERISRAIGLRLNGAGSFI